MKALFKILIVIVLLVVIAAVVLYTNLDRAVKGAVEELGPQYTGSAVTLNKVSLSPLSGEGSLGGLTVANPQGFNSTNAFTLQDIKLAVDTSSITTDTILIKTLHIVAPEITFESSKQGNNLKVLQQNIQKAAADLTGAQDSGATESTQKLIIRDFSISEGKVNYYHALLGDKPLSLTLPTIQLKGIGEKSNGVTAAEAVKQIVAEVHKRVSREVAASSAIRDLGKQYEDQFNEKKEELENKFEGVKKLKGLFGK